MNCIVVVLLSQAVDIGMGYTVWRVIFRAANFRQKSKVAVRIYFRGFKFRDWMEAQQHCARMCTHSTKYAAQRAYDVHTPSAMCVLLTIELAAIPTP